MTMAQVEVSFGDHIVFNVGNRQQAGHVAAAAQGVASALNGSYEIKVDVDLLRQIPPVSPEDVRAQYPVEEVTLEQDED
jgi:hypothetical protein